MAKNPGRLVPLVETFRRILRAQCTRAELADEITGYDWFHRRQYIGSQHNESEYRAAMTSHERVKQGVKEQQIGLRGRLHGNIEEIDPIDATQGEINVFDNTLDTGKKIYTDVHCLESDVTANGYFEKCPKCREVLTKTIVELIQLREPQTDGVRYNARHN